MEMVHFIPPSQRRLAMMAAQVDSAPVLIYGASGTGKGAIAKWIHANGPRSAKPLIVATKQKNLPGQISQAHGGTLIIPDIGAWTLSEQLVLLNYLNNKSMPNPDGSGATLLVNARVIVTTSQSLEGRAQAGLFNAKLLEKLNVFRLEMPTLSKRIEEFEDIVMGIVGEIIREFHKEHIRGLTPATWKALKSYDWPANLRELRNVMRLAVASTKGDLIDTVDLPEFGHDRIDFQATREQFEKIYILELLKTFNWQIDETCRMTRLDKGVLLDKMERYGIRQNQAVIP